MLGVYLGMWIRRKHTIQKIQKAVKTRPVILLTGVRQSGKSSILRKIYPEATYVTLDRVFLAEEAQQNPESFLDKFETPVIIDEVQYAPGLFRDLKVRVDEDRQTHGKWMLTGSQQFHMMKQVSESLAGRIRIINLFPLSSFELNEAGLIKENKDLLWKGGFPEIWAQNLDVDEFFEDYIRTYLERDLSQLLKVNNVRDFRRFFTLLALRTGQLLNFSELAKDVGVAVNTIKSWVSALETSGVIILVPPYYQNLGKRLIKSPKMYFCDNGLAASLLNIRSLSALEQSPLMGSLWENFVLTELLKQGFMPNQDLFYYRDQNGVEIDFVLEKKGQVFLLEVKSHERPEKKKLNFRKVVPLFKHKVDCVVACNVQEKGMIRLADYSLYNPLDGLVEL